MKTALLLSGGVDSSVALALLKSQGRDVTAFYLKIWLEDETSYLGSCPWEEDLSYARAVCEQLKVPLEILPLQREYHDRVVSYVIEELRRGATPSPDLFCNRLIKFGAFAEKVGSEWEKIASGHYARIETMGEQKVLVRSPDPVKDQTYFLSRMTPNQLERAEFPLGPMKKSDVRKYAENIQLPNRNRPDSQGICFLGKIPYRDFVRHYLGENPGPIRDAGSGELLGKHKGLWFYTLGQRSGLGLSGGPWYVSGKDLLGNTLILAHADALDPARKSRLVVNDLQWLADEPPRHFLDLHVKVRHGPQLIAAKFEWLSRERFGIESRASVDLAVSDLGLAPGQFTVFYDGEICMGSGRISEI